MPPPEDSSGFRTDFIISKKDREVDGFPFPIYVESDGTQHENHRKDKSGIQFELLDRVKDYLARQQFGGVSVRLRSEEQTSRQLEFVLKEMKRYYDELSKGEEDEDTIRGKVQDYADAMCLEFAAEDKREGKKNSDVLDVGESPDVYMNKVHRKIIRKINRSYTLQKKQLCDTEKKLLKIWAVDSFVLSKALNPKTDNRQRTQYYFNLKKETQKKHYGFMNRLWRGIRLMKRVNEKHKELFNKSRQ